jgi:hypothetical protein
MPKGVSHSVIKSEFISDRLKEFTSIGTIKGLMKAYLVSMMMR